MITKNHLLSITLLSINVLATVPATSPIYEKAKEMVNGEIPRPQKPWQMWRTMSPVQKCLHAEDVVSSFDLSKLLSCDSSQASPDINSFERCTLAKKVTQAAHDEFQWTEQWIGIIPFRQAYRLYTLEAHLQDAEKLLKMLSAEKQNATTKQPNDSVKLALAVVKTISAKIEMHKQNMHYYHVITDSEGRSAKGNSPFATLHTAYVTWFKK